jgi:hypothetical protein
MKKGILFILLTFVFASINATTYYISSSNGNDSRSPSEAQNPSTPWRTISKLNSFSPNLLAGDAVLFNRGETFYGSIKISNSRELYGFNVGNSTSPITIGAYGSGAKPIITGLQTISDWNHIGGGIYETNLNQESLNLVTFQGNLQPIGRWPKVSEPNAGYLTVQSHYENTNISSNAIGSAPNFTSGEVVIRKSGWILDRGIITNQSSGTVAYTALGSPNHSISTHQPQDGYGFFFQNHINALTQLGDWMFDKSNRKVRMYFGANNPPSFNVQVSTIENLINITSSTYLTFDNLSLVGSNSDAIRMNYAYNINITNCDINLSGVDAIATEIMGTCSDITVKNCNITNSNNNAVTANGTQTWTIQNNIIRNTGIIRGMGLSGDGNYNALSNPGSNSVIEYNEIRNTGYNGIDFKGDNVIIKNNFIETFCTVKSDGGGIYTYAETGKRGRKVIGNIVLNGMGDLNGRKEEDRNSLYAGNVHGIYLDNGTTDVDITDNTVANCSASGLELSAVQNVKVLNNTLFNNTQTQVYYWESRGAIHNLIFTNNILFSTRRDQLILLIAGSLDNIPNWGTLDNNYYCRPISEPDGIDSWGYSNWPKSTDDFNDGGIIQGPTGRFYSLDKWKEAVRQDINSRKTAVPISDLSQVRFEYNATNSSKTVSLDQSYVDVKGTPYSNSITLAPYSSVILLKSEATNNIHTQTIVFTPISNKTYGDAPFGLSATASSGLPVSFKILSGPATITGNTVTVTGAGIVTVEASQEGNTSYTAAPVVMQSFNVSTSTQNCKPTFVNGPTIVQDENCGQHDGKVSILPTSGVAPFEYSLDGGSHYSSGSDAGYTFVNLWPGTFRLRLKDANGCESDVVEKIVKSINCVPNTATCNPPTFINNGLTVLDATCGNSDGKITIFPLSGVAPFAYSIDGGATYTAGANGGFTFENLWVGTYRLRLKDANGCESEVVERSVRIMYGAPCDGTSNSAAVSVSPLTFDGQLIRTYPNPSRGQFKLQLINFPQGKAEIFISDAKGAVINRRQITLTGSNNTLDFNLTGQASGVYYIKITSNTFTKTSKVVIQ